MTPPKCLHCQTTMEEGYIADMVNAVRGLIAYWQAGEPKWESFVGNKVISRPSTTYPITAYRCPECGYVALFAMNVYEEKLDK